MHKVFGQEQPKNSEEEWWETLKNTAVRHHTRGSRLRRFPPSENDCFAVYFPPRTQDREKALGTRLGQEDQRKNSRHLIGYLQSFPTPLEFLDQERPKNNLRRIFLRKVVHVVGRGVTLLLLIFTWFRTMKICHCNLRMKKDKIKGFIWSHWSMKGSISHSQIAITYWFLASAHSSSCTFRISQ